MFLKSDFVEKIIVKISIKKFNINVLQINRKTYNFFRKLTSFGDKALYSPLFNPS